MSVGEKLLFSVLLAAVLVSSVAVVYNKYKTRKLFNRIEQVQRELNRFDVEWGQLQLEQNTLATHARVERIAKERLGMVMPGRESIVYLRQ